jgi:septal ring factor EnvC (AmiA/AmiB activator)
MPDRRALIPPAVLLALALIVPAPASRAQSGDRARTEALARRASERLRALHAEADALAAQARTLLGDLRRLEIEREIKAEELGKLQEELTASTQALADTEARLAEIEKRADLQRPGLASRFVELYKLGRAGYMRLLLNVQELRLVGRGYRMVSQIAALDQERIAEHQRTLDELRAARTALQQRHEQAADLEGKAREAQRALDRAIADHTRLVQSIDERRDLNAQLAGELQESQQRLQASLAGSQVVGGPVLPLGPFRGDLDWPAMGPVALRFGQRNPRLGTAVMRNGVEIAAPEGRQVRSVHEGLVVYAAPFTGFGNLVIIDHGDESYSLYGYLSSIAVPRGVAVDRRQVVGAVGRSPLGTPGLYFELRIDGKPVDPIKWLRAP